MLFGIGSGTQFEVLAAVFEENWYLQRYYIALVVKH
jgi:hypothetical protein